MINLFDCQNVKICYKCTRLHRNMEICCYAWHDNAKDKDPKNDVCGFCACNVGMIVVVCFCLVFTSIWYYRPGFSNALIPAPRIPAKPLFSLCLVCVVSAGSGWRSYMVRLDEWVGEVGERGAEVWCNLMSEALARAGLSFTVWSSESVYTPCLGFGARRVLCPHLLITSTVHWQTWHREKVGHLSTSLSQEVEVYRCTFFTCLCLWAQWCRLQY